MSFIFLIQKRNIVFHFRKIISSISLFQGKCKAAYFIVVLHNVNSVVIAVRGTETPEDLITDGLGRECCLTEGDLDSLLQ